MPAITLAPVQRTDGPELIQANLDSRVYHTPWSQPFTDLAGFDSWFAQTLTGANVAFTARDAKSHRIAGVLSLTNIVLGNFCSAYLGYYGMAEFAGTGRMTQALRLTIVHAFGELGLHRLEANIQPGNCASVALVKRLGFQKEGFSPRYLRINGVWRDHERWALVSEG
jgi:ribosomal-protein-alanine N-acetyltransferase